jgi:hypothetical protein
METLWDVREAQAHWDRVFEGKREPIKLRIGRHTILTELYRKTSQQIASIVRRTATIPLISTISLQTNRPIQRNSKGGV